MLTLPAFSMHSVSYPEASMGFMTDMPSITISGYDYYTNTPMNVYISLRLLEHMLKHPVSLERKGKAVFSEVRDNYLYIDVYLDRSGGRQSLEMSIRLPLA